MRGLFKILAVIVVTVLGLAIFTGYEEGSLDARTRIWGYPLISIAQTGATGVIAIGQAGMKGVVVLGQAGVGVIVIAQGGASILFGIGQGMVGLIAIAQIGIGLFFFLGQGGGGLQAAGQGVFGRKPGEYMKEMSSEFDELLSFRSRKHP